MSKIPAHPYFCDECGAKAGFRIPGCPIKHDHECSRFGEEAMKVYFAAMKWCRETGKVIA